jgi:hypothetical protein
MMKRIKRYSIGTVTFLILLLVIGACKKEGSYNLSELPPLDFKSYYDGLTVTFANQAKGATGISWDFGDNSATMSGDSVKHIYTKIGNYLIAMTGTYQGKQYTFHTIMKVDKPSVIKLNDNSFTDWDQVTYPDFILEGKDKVLNGKIDYDANNIYFYIEWSTTGTNGLATLNGAIMDLYLDTDNAMTTGFSSSVGADLLYEGNIPSSWFDYFKFNGTDQSKWSWNTVSIPDAIQLGNTEEAGETVKMEFAISREKFKIQKDAFGFQLILNFSDWSGELGSLARDNQSVIQVKMDKN